MPGKVLWGVLLTLVIGCGERERLVFSPNPDDHQGPTSHIDSPSTDTTLTEGDPLVIGARAVDPSGVDSVYIEVLGVDISYLPLDAEDRDTLNFAINLPTLGFFGRTITVSVHAVDVLGNIGPTASRRLTIQ